MAEELNDILERREDQGDGTKRQEDFSSSQADQNWHLRSGLGHRLVICISQ